MRDRRAILPRIRGVRPRARDWPDCRLAASAHTIARMPHVAFTSQLQRFTETPEFDTKAATLRDALGAAFELNPRLRHYVLDEQGHLRQHVIVYISGRRVVDRMALTDVLAPDDRVYVLQALTGG